MDLDVLGTSTAGVGTKKPSSGLGLVPWEPFRSTEILDICSFTYDSKTG
jgi:hypothetical protein